MDQFSEFLEEAESLRLQYEPKHQAQQLQEPQAKQTLTISTSQDSNTPSESNMDEGNKRPLEPSTSMDVNLTTN